MDDMASDANAEEDMRNVYTLGFVSFFTDVSTEVVLSLLSVFVLGLPGSSRALLGLIEGVAESLSYGLRARALMMTYLMRYLYKILWPHLSHTLIW